MEAIKIFDAEYKFMNIIWEHSPISSSELVNLAKEELGWKNPPPIRLFEGSVNEEP